LANAQNNEMVVTSLNEAHPVFDESVFLCIKWS